MFLIIPVKTFKSLLVILNLEVFYLILICCNSCLVPTDLNGLLCPKLLIHLIPLLSICSMLAH